MRALRLLLLGVALTSAAPLAAEPLYPNSVTSNDLDFIHDDDPAAAFCLRFTGLAQAEMPDKRHDDLFADDVRVFAASYSDGTQVELWVHPSIATEVEATALVTPVAQAIARLPSQMRGLLNHVVIHNGDETAFAEDVGRFFVLYSDNIRARISTHDLQETVFHESVHATLDVPHSDSDGWRAAQIDDGQFLTTYAAENPDDEDMAESALFAWAMIKHPGRLPPEIETAVTALIPNRLAYFEGLFVEWPLPDPAAPAPPC
jgi:hypothetical protein